MVSRADLAEIHAHRGPIFRFFWPVTHYLVTNFCVAIGFIYFRVLNQTTIIGKKDLPKTANVMLLSNHQSMIDSFMIGLCAYFPRTLIQPSLIPWNPAAEENFYKNPLMAWLADNWKCIPVKRGRRDLSVVYKMKRALISSPVTIFPEGTRTRSSEIGKGRAGAGLTILENRPIVVPVYIDGMNRLLPVGAIFPRLFRHIYVYYGKPIDMSEFENCEKNKENSQAVIDKVMAAMNRQREAILKLKEARKK